ncbi:HD domain-containing protein [Evansella sp. LMS18]|uniref:HD domain-containing protein n=1 Tax=Evansella sp. LMS18 TaxID=2924033 RepID=UPI0020D11EB3|nr:HD domain-containing protein [Evansella sp. LMS18]UTR12865.1 HD domain-containing protein [Evansella sp. LMS18]
MERVSLLEIYKHPICQKYVSRAGMEHAISTAEYALDFAEEFKTDPDLAVKAAFLHDMGHYTWYRNGKWDYNLYKENDIHAIKGAERAHKLLIRLGEHPVNAKEIALAILLHTDSYLPEGQLQLNPLQKVVAMADKADEEPGGHHHYKKISRESAIARLHALDERIEEKLSARRTSEGRGQPAS